MMDSVDNSPVASCSENTEIVQLKDSEQRVQLDTEIGIANACQKDNMVENSKSDDFTEAVKCELDMGSHKHENKDSIVDDSANKDPKLNDDDIFNVEKIVTYTSDEESDDESNGKKGDGTEIEKQNLVSNVDSGVSSSDSDSGSSSTSSSSSESDNDDDDDDDSDDSDDNDEKINDEDEINEDETDEPIRSKNEISNFQVPSLPKDYEIKEDMEIVSIGTITGVVDRTVVIKASKSAEVAVLKEGTVFCFEDRKPLGLLYEVFGRLQSPVYTVKFNKQEEADQFLDKKGSDVYFVGSSAEFLNTAEIKKIKGTDASNCNDEELPEEEQEFSDDEKEAAAKKSKKRKRKDTSKNAENNDSSDNETDMPEDTAESATGESKIKKPKQGSSVTSNNKQSAKIPKSVRGRLTSLPSRGRSNNHHNQVNTQQQGQMHQQQPNQMNHQQYPQTQYQQQPQNVQFNPEQMAMMQQFMNMMQHANQAPGGQYAGNQTYNSYNQQQYNPPSNVYSQNFVQNQPYSQNFNQYPQYNQYNQYPQPTSQYQPLESFTQAYQNHQQQLAQPVQPVQPVQPTGTNTTSNTALLAAQLAAALTSNGQVSLPPGIFPTPSQVQGHSNPEPYNDGDEYDPAS